MIRNVWATLATTALVLGLTGGTAVARPVPPDEGTTVAPPAPTAEGGVDIMELVPVALATAVLMVLLFAVLTALRHHRQHAASAV